MSGNADVRSLETLREFQTQLTSFRGALIKEIESLTREMRRISAWVENDVQTYWEDELKLAGRRLRECQDALSRCLSCVRADEKRPCTEEKKRMHRAKERYQLCQQKLRVARTAAAHWERTRTKNQAKAQRVADLAESDLLVAVHQLAAQIDSLQRYASLRAPLDAARSDTSRGSGHGQTQPPASEPQPLSSPSDCPNSNSDSEI